MAVNPISDVRTNTVTCTGGLSATGKCPAGYEVAGPLELPLATWADNFTYAGAFKAPTVLTEGRMDASDAQIGPSITSGNMYMTTRSNITDGGIIEIQIPTLSTSTNINDINMAAQVQTRINVFNTPDGNPESNDEIAAIYGTGTHIIYSLVQYYDGPGDNTLFFGRVDGAADLSTATLNNQIGVEGNYKAAGWISDVPAEWQSTLGYAHIMGHASNTAILGRASIGPSAYGFDLADAVNRVDPIPTEEFQGYSITTGQEIEQQINPSWDLSNSSLTNDVWTYMSRAAYGFIIPGSSTYAVIGSIGGLSSSVGYKATQTNGNVCAGYCPLDPEDWTFYYWLFDVNDWVAVKNGSKQAHEIIPYEYGPIDTPFELLRGAAVGENGLKVRGGMFDSATSTLYFTCHDNYKPGTYSTFPLVYAYTIGGL